MNDSDRYREWWKEQQRGDDYNEVDGYDFASSLTTRIDIPIEDRFVFNVFQHTSSNRGLEFISINIVDLVTHSRWGEVLADNFATRGLIYELWNCHTQSDSQGSTEVRSYATNLAVTIKTVALINAIHLLWD
jgi:hypothetical protein